MRISGSNFSHHHIRRCQSDFVFRSTYFDSLSDRLPAKIGDPRALPDKFYLFSGLKHPHFHGWLTNIYKFRIRQGIGEFPIVVKGNEVEFQSNVFGISNLKKWLNLFGLSIGIYKYTYLDITKCGSKGLEGSFVITGYVVS